MEESVVLRRARKLLRLSKSANENEATVAATMLQELCLRHNIALHQFSEDPTRLEVKQDLVFVGKNRSTWRSVLAAGIGKAYLVHPLWVKGANLIFAGNPDNLALSVEVFFYLEEVVVRLSESFLKEDFRYSPKSEAESYRLGMASRISKRLQERRIQMETEGLKDEKRTDVTGEVVTNECTALVVVNSIKKVEENNSSFITKTYGRVVHAKARRASNSDAYSRGYSDGDKINLNKQIGGRKQGSLPG